MYTTEEMLDLIRSRERELTSHCERELSSQEKPQKTLDFVDFSGCEREVYKDLKTKRQNYISREGEEKPNACPSDSLGEGTSFPEVSPEGLGEQGEGVMLSPPAITSSRTLSGISAQHHKTDRGIKVMLTLQKADEAEYCAYIEITAELKRSNRISELKPYIHDSDQFAAFYQATKQAIKDEEDIEHRRQLCIGRVHERGLRAQWVADMLVIGKLDSNQTLESIVFYYGTEEYQIPMNHVMSPRQKECYHSNGLYGDIRRQQRAPTLDTLKRKQF